MSDDTRRRTAVDAKRGTLFLCETDQLTLITDQQHPLYDSRVKLPIPEWLIRSVGQHGIIEPVIARKNGGLLEIVDGRQRYRAACEANRRGADIKVPTILRNDTDGEAAVTMILTNEQRQDDDPLTKATKAVRLLKLGHSSDDVASAFRVTKAQLSTWDKALALAPEVKDAIRAGRVGVTEAVRELSKLPREDQPRALETIAATSPAARKANGSAKKPVKESPVSRLRRIRRDETAWACLREQDKALIQWCFGEVTLLALDKYRPELAGALRRAK